MRLATRPVFVMALAAAVLLVAAATGSVVSPASAWSNDADALPAAWKMLLDNTASCAAMLPNRTVVTTASIPLFQQYFNDDWQQIELQVSPCEAAPVFNTTGANCTTKHGAYAIIYTVPPYGINGSKTCDAPSTAWFTRRYAATATVDHGTVHVRTVYNTSIDAALSRALVLTFRCDPRATEAPELSSEVIIQVNNQNEPIVWEFQFDTAHVCPGYNASSALPPVAWAGDRRASTKRLSTAVRRRRQ